MVTPQDIARRNDEHAVHGAIDRVRKRLAQYEHRHGLTGINDTWHAPVGASYKQRLRAEIEALVNRATAAVTHAELKKDARYSPQPPRTRANAIDVAALETEVRLLGMQ